MKELLIIGGSTRRQSINRLFAQHVGSQIPNVKRTVLDLNDFEMPHYSEDREQDEGIPDAAKCFYAAIQASDAIVLSLAEHNGSYTSAFKNILDWTSRHEQRLWAGKPMLLLATSPGKRGGARVLAAGRQTFPHLGAEIVASFSLPSFHEHFSPTRGITEPALKSEMAKALEQFSVAQI